MTRLRLRSTFDDSVHTETFVTLEDMLERAKRIDPDFYEILSGGVA